MAKYAQKRTKKKSSNLIVWVVAACCIALPVAIIAISWILGDHPAAPVAPRTTAERVVQSKTGAKPRFCCLKRQFSASNCRI